YASSAEETGLSAACWALAVAAWKVTAAVIAAENARLFVVVARIVSRFGFEHQTCLMLRKRVYGRGRDLHTPFAAVEWPFAAKRMLREGMVERCADRYYRIVIPALPTSVQGKLSHGLQK